VDAGFLLVCLVALFTHPEEVASDEPRERRTVFSAGDVDELFAERRKARVAVGLRQRHWDRLVGLGRGRLPGLPLRGLSGLPGGLRLRGLPALAGRRGLSRARSELTGAWRLGLSGQR